MGEDDVSLELLERFSFLEPREEVLKKLVPKTREYYLFHILHGLNQGKDVSKLIDEAAQYLDRKLLGEVEMKSKLILYTKDASKRKDICKELARTLNVNLHHSSSSGDHKTTKEEYKSSVDDVDYEFEKLLRERKTVAGHSTLEMLSLLSRDGLVHLVSQGPVEGKVAEHILSRFSSSIPQGLLPKLVRSLLINNEKSTFQTIPRSVRSCLTVDFLEELLTEIPLDHLGSEFFNAMRDRKVAVSSFELGPGSDGEKPALYLSKLTEFAQWAKTNLSKGIHFKDQLVNLFEDVLQRQVDRSIFDTALFLEYLELKYCNGIVDTTSLENWQLVQEFSSAGVNYAQQQQMFNSGYSNMKKVQGMSNNDFAQFGGSQQAWTNLNNVWRQQKEKNMLDLLPSLQKTILKHVFRSAGVDDVKPYDKYLPLEVLGRVFVTSKLLTGQAFDEDKWSLYRPGADIFKRIVARRMLGFAKSNKSTFSQTESVSLTIETKNITSVLVKVFKINNLNYYQKHYREVGKDIDLNGVVPTFTKTVSLESANALHEQSVPIPNLIPKEEEGTFVIHLYGSNLVAKCCLHKRRKMYFTETVTEAGVTCVLFDAATRQPLLKNSAIWLQDKRYACDQDGEIFLPFVEFAGAVIMEHEESYMLSSRLVTKKERYTLTGSIGLPREGLRTGEVVKAVIHPCLFLADKPLPIDCLKDAQVLVTLTCQDNGYEESRQQFKISKKELQQSSDIVVDIELKKTISSVRIVLEGYVEDSKGKKIRLELAQPKPVSVNSIVQVGENSIDDVFFLKDSADNTYVQVLGRNGEHRANRRLSVHLQHRLLVEGCTFDVKTDESGKVCLGKLGNISTVKVQYNDRSSLYTNLKLQDDAFYQMHPVSLKETKGFKLPFLERGCESYLRLVEMKRKASFKDWSSCLTVCDEHVELGDNLPPGEYILHYSTKKLKIEVQQNPAVISEQPPLVSSVVTQDDGTVKIDFVGVSEACTVHIFGSRFAYDVLDTTFSNPEAVKSRGYPIRTIEPTSIVSSYGSSMTLDKETLYIIERQKEENQNRIGNMLPKPSLLLKPIEAGSTTTISSEEELRLERSAPPPQPSGFGSTFGGRERQYMSRCAPQQRQQQQFAGAANDCEGNFSGSIPSSEWSCLDFIKSHVTAHNLPKTTTSTGSFTVTFPLADYLKAGMNMVQVVLFGGHDFRSSRIIPISSVASECPTKDLRLIHSFESNAHMIEQNVFLTCEKGDIVKIEQFTTASLEEFTSLESVFSILYETQNGSPPNKKEKYLTLFKWENLPLEEKLDYIEEFGSHEVNFFLFHKDRAFFEDVIKPGILSKLHRTLMDDYLAGEDLSLYSHPSVICQLSNFEKLLLADRLKLDLSNWLSDHLELDVVKDGIQEQLNKFWALCSNVKEEGVETEVYEEEPESCCDDFEVVNAPDAAVSDFCTFAPMAAPGGGFGAGGVPPPPPPPTAASAPKFNKYAKMKKMSEAAAAYEEIEDTKKFVETESLLSRDVCMLFDLNQFWLDYYTRDKSKPFVSKNFAQVGSSLNELLFALGVLDLPLSSSASSSEKTFVGADVELKVRSERAIVAYQNIAPLSNKLLPTSKNVMIYQHFFDPMERTRYDKEKKETVDNFIDDGQFQVNKEYVYELIISSMSSSRQTLKVLHQIPQGAIPLGTSLTTHKEMIPIEPYGTYRRSYSFYFPQAGEDFSFFPAHAIRKNTLVGFGEPYASKIVAVVEKGSESKVQNWSDVVSSTVDNVVSFLKDCNLERVDLRKLAYRMREVDLFKAVLQVLRERVVFCDDLWGYGFYHNDPKAMSEYLLFDYGTKDILGRGYFASAKELFDPEANQKIYSRRVYQHQEYSPLANPRAHSDRILFNVDFANQYRSFLEHLARVDDIVTVENMSQLLYFLVMQGRFDDCLNLFSNKKLKESGLEGPNIDYMTAYLEFSTVGNNLEKARAILDAHKTTNKVPRWKRFFEELELQLEEIDSGAVSKKKRRIANQDFQKQEQTLKADASMSCKIENDKVLIQYANLESFQGRLNIYDMDVEPLFSSDPFVGDSGINDMRNCSSAAPGAEVSASRFTFVQANKVVEFRLPEVEAGTFEIDLPKDHQSNVRVEVQVDGIVQSRNHFSRQIFVQFLKSTGQLLVQDSVTKKPIPATYVKVYARKRSSEGVVFFKDGYTDRRGLFDFVTVSGNISIKKIEKFAILIKTKTAGSLVLQTAPPIN